MRTRRTPAAPVTLFAIALALVLGAGCSSRSGSAPAAGTDATARPATFVTMGGSATEGDGVEDRLRAAWPYLVYHESLPRSAALVNAALDDATVKSAIEGQLPMVKETKPDIVAMWLGADDLIAGTPIDEYASSLREMIREVRGAGARLVLVADLPTTFGSGAAAYNAALRGVVASEHAVLVELEHATITLAPVDGLAPQPDAQGQRTVADAFEKALRDAS